jgi:hypothetical protein
MELVHTLLVQINCFPCGVGERFCNYDRGKVHICHNKRGTRNIALKLHEDWRQLLFRVRGFKCLLFQVVG